MNELTFFKYATELIQLMHSRNWNLRRPIFVISIMKKSPPQKKNLPVKTTREMDN